MIYPTADAQNQNIGENTRVWQFVVILPGARVGHDCNICSHCLIEKWNDRRRAVAARYLAES